jgi:hypothetical protein
VPALIAPDRTSCAPHQSTPTIDAETMKMMPPVSKARAMVEARAATKASSAARVKRDAVRSSMP